MDCRLCCCCFQSKENYLSCLQEFPGSEDIAEVITFHLHIKITEHDMLPKYVCTECWTTVLNFHTFYQNVEIAELKFVQTNVKYGDVRQQITNKYRKMYSKVSKENQDDSEDMDNDFNQHSNDDDDLKSILGGTKSQNQNDAKANDKDSDDYLLNQMCSDIDDNFDINDDQDESEKESVEKDTSLLEELKNSPHYSRMQLRVPKILDGIYYKLIERTDNIMIGQCCNCPKQVRGGINSTGNFFTHIRKQHPNLLEKSKAHTKGKTSNNFQCKAAKVTYVPADDSSSSFEPRIPKILDGVYFKFVMKTSSQFIGRCSSCSQSITASKFSTGNFYSHIKKKHPTLVKKCKMHVKMMYKKQS